VLGGAVQASRVTGGWVRKATIGALILLAGCSAAPTEHLATIPESGKSANPTTPAETPFTPAPTTPAPSDPTTPSPRPHPKPRRTRPPVSCPTDPLRGVYHPSRLHVLGTCRWYVGTVERINHEQDGDYHVDIQPAKGYKRFLNYGNYAYEHGQLVTEIMPGQSFPAPYVGERLAMFGTWVYDSDHGWNEIHPIWTIEYLSSGRAVTSLPVVPPRYDPDGGGGGGGGGGNCDPSYPTVCIPHYPPDLDCADVSYHDFKVLPPDLHGFDGDHDGIGCES
jgi:hypothetical protein